MSESAAAGFPENQSALAKGIRSARRGNKVAAQRFLSAAIQQEPASEEAWLWLARVQENPQDQAASLQRVLQLNPENKWAAEQLATLQAQANQPSQQRAQTQAVSADSINSDLADTDLANTAAFANTPKGLTTFACPHCAAALQIHNPESRVYACQFCKTVIDLSAAQPSILGSNSRWAKPLQPIEPGMKGTFNKIEYEVIGWVQYEGRDDEEVWRWDEWSMLSAKGDFLWLSYSDDEGFLLQKRQAPTEAFNFQLAEYLPTEDGKVRIQERSTAKIRAIGGELTWKAAVDDKMLYLEAHRGDYRYSAELIPNQELEIFRGKGIPAQTVWQAFQRQDKLDELSITEQLNGFFKKLCFTAIVLAIAALAILLTLTPQTIFSGELLLQAGEAGAQETAPFSVSNVRRPLRVSIRGANIPANTWSEVDVALVDDEENEYLLFTQELWHETGYDEGAWDESSLRGSYRFKLPEPGQYSIELTLDGESTGTKSDYPVQVTVEERVWVTEYVLAAAVFMILMAVYFGIRASNHTIGSFVEMMSDNDE